MRCFAGAIPVCVQSRFECVNCGYEGQADRVGATNILERGHRLLVCGESVLSGRSVKQESAEVTQKVALCHV